MVAGQILETNVYAKDLDEAKDVFFARQPNGQIIQITKNFLWFSPFRIACKGDENMSEYVCMSNNCTYCN